jgi:hypothetical protein
MADSPTAYLTELRWYDRRNGYLQVPLPKAIETIDDLQPMLEQFHRVRREELEKEKKDDALFPKLRTTEEGTSYIRIYFEKHGRHGLVIAADDTNQERSLKEKTEQELDNPNLTEQLRYYMRIPVEFIDTDPDSPIHGFGFKSEVTVELDHENNQLRLYSPDGYRDRHEELNEDGRRPEYKKLTATGLALPLTDGYIDLTAVGQRGRKFRFVPFNAQHTVFKSRAGQSNERSKPRVDSFDKVLEQNRVPAYRARNLTVSWSPTRSRRFSKDGWTEIKDNESRERPIHTENYADELKIMLPSKGEYRITTETKYGENQSVLTYSRSGPRKHDRRVCDNWYTKYHKNEEHREDVTVYVPCNSE